jgi:hypothetical protein
MLILPYYFCSAVDTYADMLKIIIGKWIQEEFQPFETPERHVVESALAAVAM